MDNPLTKIDPIRAKYYRPLELAELWGDILFYIAALLSLAALIVDKSTHPTLYEIAQIFFILAVVGIWSIGITIRIYFAPRAQDRRFQDFLSNAFGVALSHDQTAGYYNTDAAGPNRIGAQLLENAFHSKDTALRMTWIERWKLGIYVVLLLIAILNRNTDLVFLALAAQAVFSEQLLSRWARLEWLRIKFERIYDELFRLFQSKPDASKLEVMILELLGQYESAKANAAITLSESIFNQRNKEVSEEWQKIKKLLGF